MQKTLNFIKDHNKWLLQLAICKTVIYWSDYFFGICCVTLLLVNSTILCFSQKEGNSLFWCPHWHSLCYICLCHVNCWKDCPGYHCSDCVFGCSSYCLIVLLLPPFSPVIFPPSVCFSHFFLFDQDVCEDLSLSLLIHLTTFFLLLVHSVLDVSKKRFVFFYSAFVLEFSLLIIFFNVLYQLCQHYSFSQYCTKQRFYLSFVIRNNINDNNYNNNTHTFRNPIQARTELLSFHLQLLYCFLPSPPPPSENPWTCSTAQAKMIWQDTEGSTCSSEWSNRIIYSL